MKPPIELFFDEATGEYTLTPTSDEGGKAEMEQNSMLGKIQKPLDKAAGFAPVNIPIGGVGVGFAGAYLIDRLVGDQLGKWGDLGNLAAAVAVGYLGPKVIGKEASKWVSAIIIYEVAKPHLMEWLDKIWPAKEAAADTTVTTEQARTEQPAAGMGQNTAYRNLGVYQGVF